MNHFARYTVVGYWRGSEPVPVAAVPGTFDPAVDPDSKGWAVVVDATDEEAAKRRAYSNLDVAANASYRAWQRALYPTEHHD